jgi:hypothetical protein
MNHHYIDYMIKQQQRDEIEDSERRRMVKAAGYDHPGLMYRVVKMLIETVRGVKSRLGLRKQNVLIRLAAGNQIVKKKGVGT